MQKLATDTPFRNIKLFLKNRCQEIGTPETRNQRPQADANKNIQCPKKLKAKKNDSFQFAKCSRDVYILG
jgi:hypothetical protein